MNKLAQLKQHTTIVADTGDFAAIERFAPEDATTNPSLLLKAVAGDEYRPLLDRAREYAGGTGSQEQVDKAADCLAVLAGLEILEVVPGRVSTEVDARLSFDRDGTLARARRIMSLYEENGVARDRVLIKIASTWEGIAAAETLEREGINCNLTLLFSFAQARACADAGVFLISPFVGRIFDWYRKRDGVDAYAPADDPGVQSVQRIYAYYKRHGYDTVVMGASFRNTEQVLELAGCDRLTIAPSLLEELEAAGGDVPVRLSADNASSNDEKVTLGESAFRYDHNEDAMATEKLAEGIRAFAADQVKLEGVIRG